MPTLPLDASERKGVPLANGCFDYFPSALAAVAALSAKGNDQHHAGTPLHWDRSKSYDHDDALLRHFMERGAIDADGVRHAVKVAWRALALLQEELERDEGAPMPRNARNQAASAPSPAPAPASEPSLDPDVAALMPEHAPPASYAGD